MNKKSTNHHSDPTLIFLQAILSLLVRASSSSGHVEWNHDSLNCLMSLRYLIFSKYNSNLKYPMILSL